MSLPLSLPNVVLERPILLVLLLAVPVALLLALATRQERARGVRLALATLLRATTLALVAAAAAGPSWTTSRARTSVVFVLDVSASVGRKAADEGARKIRELAGTLRSNDEAAVVLAARDARVVVPRGSASRLASFALEAATLPPGDETDLARALRLAEAALPPSPPEGAAPDSGERRIVLLSDGRETRGSARDEAARLLERGVHLDVVPIPEEAPPDARVISVGTAEPVASLGEGLAVSVRIASTRAVHARVTLSRDGVSRPEWSREVDLERLAPETLVFRDRAEERGNFLYEARIEAPGDEEPGNDRASCALLVRGGPEAILVETENETQALGLVLEAQGFRVRRVRPSRFPGEKELEGADLVVLAGPLSEKGEPETAGTERAALLERFVREGGGLVAVGGTSSYALGGWQDTELEAALPVRIDAPSRGEQPSVALVIAIDKSGSMNGPKLELAKLAARSALTALASHDEAGVIAFNYNAYWIVPLSRLTDRKAIASRIEMQAAGGGTDLMPSLRAARSVLEPSNARVRHFLVLTDGIAGDGDAVVAYTAQLAQEKITTSTVAVGEDADQDLLKRIAEAGHGRHQSADRVSELPRIVLQETLAVARQAMEEEPFKAVRARPHPVLAGVEIERAPVLHGINTTRAKPLAQVLLEGPRGLPLLSVWEHGLGRAAAWTTDATPAWAGEWLAWEGFPKLVSQLARHVARREALEEPVLALSTYAPSPGETVVRAEARRRDGSFASGLSLECVVKTPETGAARVRARASGESEGEVVARAPFENTAPGRYEARLRGLAPGGYLALAMLGQVRAAVAGFALPCAPEHAERGPDRRALEALALAGSGRLAPASLAGFAAPGVPEREPLAGRLLLLAAFLVPIELAVRRLRR